MERYYRHCRFWENIIGTVLLLLGIVTVPYIFIIFAYVNFDLRALFEVYRMGVLEILVIPAVLVIGSSYILNKCKKLRMFLVWCVFTETVLYVLNSGRSALMSAAVIARVVLLAYALFDDYVCRRFAPDALPDGQEEPETAERESMTGERGPGSPEDAVYQGEAYPGVMWICESCGALLNRQKGFRDNCGRWVCTGCGHVNLISVSEYCDGAEAEPQKTEKTILSGTEPEANEQSHGFFGKLLCFAAVLLILVLFGFDIWRDMFRIGVPMNSSECIGRYYDEVERAFRGAGYTDVVTEPVAYLNDGSQDDIAQRENAVQSISVNGDEAFGEGKEYLKNVPVVIRYYARSGSKLREMPLGAQECVGRNYKDIIRQFREAGFTDLTVMQVADLSAENRFVNDARVDTLQRVTANGSGSFNSGDMYPPETKIVLYYHVYGH